MVPDLVREHVRLGEVAWCPELFGQHLEELQVEVDAAVEQAVVGTGLGVGRSAWRPRRADEDDDLRRNVRRPCTLELPRPIALDVAHDEPQKLLEVLPLLSGGGLSASRRR